MSRRKDNETRSVAPLHSIGSTGAISGRFGRGADAKQCGTGEVGRDAPDEEPSGDFPLATLWKARSAGKEGSRFLNALGGNDF